MSFDLNLDLKDLPPQWIEAAQDATNNLGCFNKWQKLIEMTEFLPSLSSKHKYSINSHSPTLQKQLLLTVYENLLVNFPYLEQYWLNYAKWTFQFGYTTKTIDIYERSLNILPKSLLIWSAYTNFLIATTPDTVNMINNFERAREAIGFHYFAHSFYDTYLSYLENLKLYREFHLLLRRILEVPLYQYLKYFKLFFKLIENSDLESIKWIIELKELEASAKLTWPDLIEDENLKATKTELKKRFTDLYITTQFHVWRIFNFEKELKRAYWIPGSKLERNQLLTWKSYLEYLETANLKVATKEREIELVGNNNALIDTVYQRCLTVTAEYPYFWIKLSNYYLNYNDIESARKVLLKGLYVMPITNLKLRMRLVDLEIMSRNILRAKSLILEFLNIMPNCLEATLKLMEVEYLINKDNILKIISLKLDEVEGTSFEEQFDYLFFEVLSYSSLSPDILEFFFKKYHKKKKSSFYFLKSQLEFYKFYKQDTQRLKEIEQMVYDCGNKAIISKMAPFLSQSNKDWECEYF